MNVCKIYHRYLYFNFSPNFTLFYATHGMSSMFLTIKIFPVSSSSSVPRTILPSIKSSLII